jgi:hypothetical protein
MAGQGVPGFDPAGLVVPLAGGLVATEDRWEPYRLVDGDSAIVAAAGAYFGHLQAAGRGADGPSPDGTQIVFEHRGSIFTVHPDGTGLAKVPLATSSGLGGTPAHGLDTNSEGNGLNRRGVSGAVQPNAADCYAALASSMWRVHPAALQRPLIGRRLCGWRRGRA